MNLEALKSDENYRFTSLRSLDLDHLPPATETTAEIPNDLKSDKEENEILFISGKSARLRQKVIISKFSDCTNEEKELIGFSEVFASDPFFKLAHEKAKDGIFVRIPKNAHVANPVRLLHYLDEFTYTSFQPVFILAEEGSSVVLVDEVAGRGRINGRPPFCTRVIQILAKERSNVKYVSLQGWGKTVEGFVRRGIQAGRDSNVEIVCLSWGGNKIQTRSEMECLEKGATITLTGAARADETQHFDFWITSRHTVPDTQSYSKYWTVLADSARAIFNGNIIITPEAVRTNAEQQNRNMLLSNTAVVDSLPKLEIATDEVKCAHGSTTTPVNLDQLYYLQSRGISSRKAEAMIINGFTHPVLKKIPSLSIRKRVRHELFKKHFRSRATT